MQFAVGSKLFFLNGYKITVMGREDLLVQNLQQNTFQIFFNMKHKRLIEPKENTFQSIKQQFQNQI